MLAVHEFPGHDDTLLRYGVIQASEGPSEGGHALLFVPGLGGSVKGALDFLGVLSEQFDTIYAPDLRGFGLNPLDSPLTSPRGFLQDIQRLCQHTDLFNRHQSVTLMGISLGGVLATHLAVAHGTTFQRLILLAPAYKPSPQSFSLGYILKNTVGALMPGYRARLPYTIEAVTRNPAILSDPHALDPTRYSLTASFLIGVRSLALGALAKMPLIQVPTLMVVPGQDLICDAPTMRQAFGKLPGPLDKHCLEYPDLYHDVLMEPEATDVARDVAAWLRR